MKRWTLLLALVAAAAPAQEPRELTLRESMRLAMELSPSIQIANLRALESRGHYGAVRAGYLPQVNARVAESVQTTNLRGLGLAFPGFPSRVGPFQVFDARPSVSQTVFDLSLVHRMAAARERVRQADLDALALREAVTLAVVDLYLRAIEADARTAAAEARRATAERLFAQAGDFLEVGTGNRLEWSRARAQFENETAAVARARRDAETVKLMLARTIGLDPGEPLVLTEALDGQAPAPPEIEEFERRALDLRPETRAARSRLAAAGKDLRAARAARLPTLGFQADYGVLGDRVGRSLSTYAVRGVLDVPVFQGGRIAAEVSAADARRRQVEQALRDAENEVRMDVRVARVQLEAAAVTAQSALRAAEAAAESVELARLRFEAGLTSNLDVVSAQQDLARADEQRIGALYELYLARANLAKAGGDVATFLE